MFKVEFIKSSAVEMVLKLPVKNIQNKTRSDIFDDCFKGSPKICIEKS
jgi:hypothetical protein